MVNLILIEEQQLSQKSRNFQASEVFEDGNQSFKKKIEKSLTTNNLLSSKDKGPLSQVDIKNRISGEIGLMFVDEAENIKDEEDQTEYHPEEDEEEISDQLQPEMEIAGFQESLNEFKNENTTTNIENSRNSKKSREQAWENLALTNSNFFFRR